VNKLNVLVDVKVCEGKNTDLTFFIKTNNRQTPFSLRLMCFLFLKSEIISMRFEQIGIATVFMKNYNRIKKHCFSLILAESILFFLIFVKH
jgi:hypothetical protein